MQISTTSVVEYIMNNSFFDGHALKV
jgi:hypothetical protein